MAAHTEFRKGQPILIFYKDGYILPAKFVEKKSKVIVIEVDGEKRKVAKKLIKEISINRK